MVSEVAQAYFLFSVFATIGLPVSCYSGYLLYKDWNEQYIIKRRRAIILILYLLNCYQIIIEFPLYGLFSIIDVNDKDIVATISVILRNWFMSCILLRIYLLYYDHEYNRLLKVNKWQILIDPSSQNNWFLTHRHKRYGNDKWIITYLQIPINIFYAIVYITIRTVIVSLNNVSTQFYWIYDLSFVIGWSVFIFIIGAYFWSRYPSFADKWLIRKEITILLFLILCAIIELLIVVILIAVADLALFLTAVIIGEVILSIAVYIMIIYPQSADNRTKKQIRLSFLNSGGAKEHFKITWQELIETTDGYEQFANFLEKELSTENLLFVTEYVQLKAEMNQKNNLAVKMEELKLDYELNLPDSVPLSKIAQTFTEELNDTDINDESKVNEIFFTAINEIYGKYIDSSSAQMEVNISSKRRRAIENAFNNKSIAKTVENIMPVMEKAVLEISSLLNDSRGRFKQKTMFTELAIKLSKSRSSSLR